MVTMSARDFNRDVSAAKRAAAESPLIITDRGQPAFVLLTVAEYDRLTEKRSIVDWIQMDVDIDFEPARLESKPQAADL